MHPLDQRLLGIAILFLPGMLAIAIAIARSHKMGRIIDDWGLRYPGVKKVEQVYFYKATVADHKTRRSYLERAYKLGKEFAR